MEEELLHETCKDAALNRTHRLQHTLIFVIFFCRFVSKLSNFGKLFNSFTWNFFCIKFWLFSCFHQRNTTTMITANDAIFFFDRFRSRSTNNYNWYLWTWRLKVSKRAISFGAVSLSLSWFASFPFIKKLSSLYSYEPIHDVS